jgi:predicted lactoylglutathione lyase
MSFSPMVLFVRGLTTALFSTALLVVPLLVCSPKASAQKIYRNPKFGFEFKIPRDFHEVPINLDEKWVVAKFLYKRPLEGKRVFRQMTPEVRVIIFPKFSAKEFSKKRISKVKKGKETVITALQNPYRNYKEYLRENYKKGGWFVKEEKELKIAGYPTVRKIIEVSRKMMGETKASDFIYSWEIQYPDATYVFHFEILADYVKKFRTSIKGSVRSFKSIPRTEDLKTPTSAGVTVRVKKIDPNSKATEASATPEGRRKARKDKLARIVKKAKSSLPPGWAFYQKKPFIYLYNQKVGLRFVKRVAKQSNMLWKWLHQNLDFIGEDFAVGGVIRICNSQAEANAYIDTSGKNAYSARTREVVIYKDRDWGFDEMSWYLNAGITQRFLADKNERLWYSLPPWLDDGFTYYIKNFKPKNGRLASKPSDYEMEIIRDYLRSDKFRPAKELIQAKYGKGYDSNKLEDRVEALAISNFLMTKGQKKKKYAKIIPTYLRILDQEIRDLEREFNKNFFGSSNPKKKKKGKKGDEEKENWLRSWKEKRNKIFKTCLKKTFKGWTDRDWGNLDKAWRKAWRPN